MSTGHTEEDAAEIEFVATTKIMRSKKIESIICMTLYEFFNLTSNIICVVLRFCIFWGVFMHVV
jgi:hypothetical protein